MGTLGGNMTPELKAKFENALTKTIEKYNLKDELFVEDISNAIKQEFPECKIECISGRRYNFTFKMIATKAIKILLTWNGMWQLQLYPFDKDTFSYKRSYPFGCTSSTGFPYDALKEKLGDAIKNRVDETGDIVPKILKYVKKRLKLETSHRKSGSFKYIIKVQGRDVYIQQVNDRMIIGGNFYFNDFQDPESIEIADPNSMNKIVEKIIDTVRFWNKNEIISINNDIEELQKKKMMLQGKQVELQDCVLPELDEEEEK